jgi:predicted unusual protein kinase regulating ubiquinone biosynthesis (AarF/ABC1/UbiB family)
MLSSSAMSPPASLRRRLGRALRLGASSARASTGWAAASLLRGLGGDAAAEAIVRASSARVAAGLGRMKGLAMKVGQYLSFALPDLPPEVRDALAVLQTSSPARPFEAVAAVIEAELGIPVDQAFRGFERTPLAAASIGQVHRAALPDGTRVAVKVQYPDVAEAVRADLANAALLARTLRLLVPGLDADGVAGELRERILEELDYRAEARWQTSFGERFAGHPFVAVPPVVASHSAGRVLTTGLADGRDFAAALRDPAPVRSRHGEILFRFLLRCVLLDGTFVADPHPGNYRFDAAGARTVFLDYGCVKALPAATRDALRELTRGALDHEPAVVRDAAQRLGLLQEGTEGTAVVSAFSHLFAPFRRDAIEPFPPVLTGPALRAATGPAASLSAVRRDLRVPAGLPFVNRTVVGMYSVLARLGAVANWHRIAREYAFGDPPSTELGEAERAWQERRRA